MRPSPAIPLAPHRLDGSQRLDDPSAQMSQQQARVQMARFPHPFHAMLAICSDLDETADAHVYFEIMRFLNTTRATAMGPGVGLEVGNSIYFDMPPDQFAYWNTDEAGRQMVRTLIRSGHIDCLHSYGDLATTRNHARRSLDELAKHDCRLEVWVDHGTAPTNLGLDIMQGHGDEPGHPAYHADLTVAHGIRYVWRGRVTSVLGQGVRPRLGHLFSARHPLWSSRTIAKECAKRLLARCGSAKYAMHAANELLRPTRLRDGSPVYEFIRSNPHWGGVSRGETAQGIGEVLTDGFLDHLTANGGVCVLYTHLGKLGPRAAFDARAVAGFQRLGEAFQQGRVLVTTPRRLLGHCRAAREVAVHTAQNEGGLWVHLDTTAMACPDGGRLSRSDLDGLTFYVVNPGVTRVTVNGREVTDLSRNPPDDTGSESVSIPWRRLEFPCP
ncbi:MAG: hypothetical protein NTU94_12865 [Planctomycetota bacterium]|nr:hypothetical protein [Planctomycetota bacterium]